MNCTTRSSGGGGGGGGGVIDIQAAVQARLDSGDCRKKVNALLKKLGKGNIKDKKTGATGIDALVGKFFDDNRVQQQQGGLSNYNAATGIITMNVDATRVGGAEGLLNVLGKEFIHEGLHGASRSGFSHKKIFKAIASLEGINFKEFTKERKLQLKDQKSTNKDKDSALHSSAMNSWINDNCGG